MKETGFYWIQHTKDSPFEIGHFSTDTERWTFCGIGRSLESKDFYAVRDTRVSFENLIPQPPTVVANVKTGPGPQEVEFDVEPVEQEIFGKIIIPIEHTKLFGRELTAKRGRFVLNRSVFGKLHYAQLQVLFSNMIVIGCQYDKAKDAYNMTALSHLFQGISDYKPTPPLYKIRFDLDRKGGPAIIANRAD
jgi:hypothetical protein